MGMTHYYGEENIANEESPHKCPSVQAYNMRTFFNKEIGHVHKLLKFYNNQTIHLQSN